MSKLIVVEGTDCSGKETQTNFLVKRLKKEGTQIEKLGYPMYGTPTGDIVGVSYLGKNYIFEEIYQEVWGNNYPEHLNEIEVLEYYFEEMLDNNPYLKKQEAFQPINEFFDKLKKIILLYKERTQGIFPEGAANVDAEIAMLYYAADRKFHDKKIKALLNNGYDVVLDRYVESNMGHQGGKLHTKKERRKMYKMLERLEYKLLKLTRPDLIVFLYMPYQYALELKKNRPEAPDQHEMSEEHLINAERAYLELAKRYKFSTINCVNNGSIRTKEDIHKEVYTLVKKHIKLNRPVQSGQTIKHQVYDKI